MERTLIILKPDALQRSLVGEIIGRFERKGLKIVGMKMMELDDLKLDEHYEHHKDKPFFGNLKRFMKSSPVLLMVLEGAEVVMTNWNLVHASDSLEMAEKEIKRFFEDNELFSYDKTGWEMIYEEEFKG